MRAQLLTGHGGLEMLELHPDHPTPEPGPEEVLISVSACGMNNTDVNTRVGWYSGGSWSGPLQFPRIQGADVVGRIEATGRGVSTEKLGQRVLVDPWIRGATLGDARYLGSEIDGGYADYVVVPATNARAVASPLSDVELATFACSYSTAAHMLERAGLATGQWIVVSGASGGVGAALIQLAKLRGAKVIALTSEPKIAAVSSLGADVVLDRELPALATRVSDATDRIDVFADVVGGAAFDSLFPLIGRGGHYVVAGAVAGHTVELDLRTLYLRDMTMHGATVVPEEVFTRLIGHIESGRLQPLVDRVFPLDRLREAEEYFLRRAHLGSVVIEVGRTS